MSLMVEDAISAVVHGYDADEVVDALLGLEEGSMIEAFPGSSERESIRAGFEKGMTRAGDLYAGKTLRGKADKLRVALGDARKVWSGLSAKEKLKAGSPALLALGIASAGAVGYGLHRWSKSKKREAEEEAERNMPRSAKAMRYLRRKAGR